MQQRRTNGAMGLAMALVLASGPVLASGDDYEPSFRYDSAPQSSGNLDLGRLVVFGKLTCGSCPLPREEVGPREARELLEALDANPDVSRGLSSAERRAAADYLKSRFGL